MTGDRVRTAIFLLLLAAVFVWQAYFASPSHTCQPVPRADGSAGYEPCP